MTDHLTSRAQRLIDEFDEGRDTRHGIAKVLRHLEGAYGDPESWGAVPASTLVKLAEELTTAIAPALDSSLVERVKATIGHTYPDDARAAIHLIAGELRTQCFVNAADWLKQEAKRG